VTVPLYNLTDSWNNGATVFTAIQMNVTNTASAAGSKLIDLQIGGVSTFNVRSDAITTIGVGNTPLDTQNPLQINTSVDGGGIVLASFNTAGPNPTIKLLYSHTSTFGGQGALVSGDFIGDFVWTGSDGTAFHTGARFLVTADANWSLGSCPTLFSFQTTQSGASSATEAMRIDSNQVLTIGNHAAFNTTDFLQINASLNGGGYFHAAFNTSGSNPAITFLYSRTNSVGGQGALNSGDFLAEIVMRGSDGAAFRSGARIRATADGAWSSGSAPTLLTFQTTPSGGTGTVEAWRIDNAANLIAGTGAIATNATNGFTYIATCAGTPTGTPTTYTGRVPMVYDTTNHQFWFFDGGGWKQPKTPAAAAIVTWQ
jgi:hypothetical protein